MTSSNTGCDCKCKTCNKWGTDEHCGVADNKCYKRTTKPSSKK